MEPKYPGQPPTPSMTVQCPHCSAQLTIAPSQAGQVAACSHCDGKFQLPLPTAFVQPEPGQLVRKEFVDKKLAVRVVGGNVFWAMHRGSIATVACNPGDWYGRRNLVPDQKRRRILSNLRD